MPPTRPSGTSFIARAQGPGRVALGRGPGMALPVLLIAAGALCPLPVRAWPERPVTLVIPFAPGGAADAAMRVIGPRLSRHLGHPVVVENKPGAGGVVGTQFVARATGDGHTQLVGSAGNAITSALSTQLPYDFEKDLLPVTQIASVPGVLVVQSSLPVKSVKDLVALLKAEPGARSFGSPGQGTSVHMAGELFQHMTGTRMLHVPYRGASNALTDLLGGQLDLMFPALAAAQPYIKSGKVRALAVTGKARTSLAPDLPTVAEAGIPHYEVGAWIGLFAPAGIAQPVVDRAQGAMGKVLAEPDTSRALLAIGVEPQHGTQAEFRQLVRAETARWAGLIREMKTRGTL